MSPSPEAPGPVGASASASAPPRQSSLDCRPLTAVIGAEVRGLDLREVHSEPKRAALRAALGRYHVLFFRGQHLDDVAQLALARNATVTICHSRTADLAAEVSRADIVIAAVGVTKLVEGDWIKDGATVLDVGINRGEDGKLVGDVDFNGALERAEWITPVPGGVGPMTIALLLANTVTACARLTGHSELMSGVDEGE